MTLLPLTSAQRQARFGKFRFQPDPVPGNPEHVRILDGWAEHNIIAVHLPQVAKVTHGSGLVFANAVVAASMQAIFADWESDGLLPLILTFDGAWAPRFKRQAGTPEERAAKCRLLGAQSLSNHAWGTAFDLNASLLPLGVPIHDPPVRGDLRQLEPIANAHGWFWGGRFRSRVDMMHTECVGPT